MRRLRLYLYVTSMNQQLLKKHIHSDYEQVSLELEAFDIHDKTFQWKQQKHVTLPPNSSTDLLMLPLPGQPVLTKQSEVSRTIVINARLVDQDGTVISRNANW